jgi:formate dehydrogenase (NADP+) beta subunit
LTVERRAKLAGSFEVTLPTAEYYEDEVECRSGCPVHTDARGYLLATAEGNYREAYAISRATNPFASICGKVCGAPCEKACRRSDVDETLSIRNIKGFLTARHGPETGDLKTPLTYSTVMGSVDPEPKGMTVGIIGGGCAGYTAAHDLARLGYQCTIYERHHVSGGMLNQGVPINRLDRHVIQAEIDSILELGLIDVKHSCDIGKDLSFQEVKDKHDALFIGVGLCVGKRLPMPNADHEDVHRGLAFLLDFNFGKRWDLAGKRAIVIGGGDVAFDVARSALRCESPEVNLICLEREALGEMTSSADEREGGRREGVIISDGWGPDEIVVEDGQFKGLRIKKVKSVFDADGRFSPVFENEQRMVDAEVLFFAVGQGSDLTFLEGSGVAVDKRGCIVTDLDTGATSVEGVFAGGDISLGPKLFIDAIECGSKAALGIDSYLGKQALQKKHRQIDWKDLDEYARDSAFVNADRVDREEEHFDLVAEPERNSTIEYPPAVAEEQGARCLACHIHPTFEGNICVLCGGCVDVCPSYCLRMVHVSRVQGDGGVDKLIRGEFGETVTAETDGSVMLFDPLKCIRCGMCAQKCPTGACKMSVNSFCDCFVDSDKVVDFAAQSAGE